MGKVTNEMEKMLSLSFGEDFKLDEDIKKEIDKIENERMEKGELITDIVEDMQERFLKGAEELVDKHLKSS